MIKEKLKNCLLIVILSILFIASMFAIIGLSSCSVKKTILSNDINIENDNLNLKKDYYVDDNGNVVSQNLYNGKYRIGYYDFNTGSFVSNSTSFACLNDIIVSPSTTYCFNTSIIQWHGTDDRGIRVLFYNDGNYLHSFVNINLSTGVFTTPSNCNLITFFLFDNYGTSYQNDIMLSLGSSPLPFEPFGTFVPSTLVSNNIFYNAQLDYYFNLNVSSPGISHVVGADLLQGDTFLSINQFLHLYFDSNTNQEYTENTNLSYWKLTFNKSFPLEQLILNFDTTQANTFDYYVTYYFEDGSTYIYHNESNSDFYRSFNVDLTQVNGLSGKFVNAISFRRQYSYMVNTISVGSYLIGFNDGLTQANTNHKEEIDSLNHTIKDKDIEIQDLEFTIRDLNERLNTNINNLFYTMISAVMSTPFNILHDYLNWNFFGINLFSLFTSLVTLLIILWVVKFLLGRK